MKNIFYSAVIVLISLSQVYGQNNVDVLRYSQYEIGGSSRNIALGGAIGGVGADFSSAFANPAGLALYRKSDLFLTPTLYYSNVNSKFLGNKMSENKMNFNFNDVGFVLASDNGSNSDWKFVNFAFGYNRINNLNNFYEIGGNNYNTSIVTDLVEQAYGYEPENLSPFSTLLAYESGVYAGDSLDNNGNRVYYSELENGGAYQNAYIEERGSVNEYLMSIAGNYNDKLYLGLSFAYQTVKFTQDYYYKEMDREENVDYFTSMSFNRFNTTEGGGFNVKLGFLYRPIEWLRFGGSVQTPTTLKLEDNYSAVMSTTSDYGDYYVSESDDGYYDYVIKTPLRVKGDISFMINKMMILSASYQLVDYSSGKLRSENYDFIDENAQVVEKYQAASNVNLGAEFNLNNIMLRMGYAYYESPFAENINDGERMYFTGGVGFKGDKGFYSDFSFLYNVKNEDFYIYHPSLVDAANLNYQRYKLSFTLGKKF